MLVLALHVLGVVAGLWLAAGDPFSDAVVAQQPLTVMLLRPPRPPAHEVPPKRIRSPTAERQVAAPAVDAPRQEGPPAVQPQAIHVPVPAPAAASAVPLNLALPRAASAGRQQRHPGMDDTRANTPHATLESRLNAVMGDGREVVEDLGEGKKRVRRGSHCTIVQRSRAAELDPTMQSFRPTPALMGKC
jgi:hypothetical protein